MREQIEILASLQNVDREIREKSGVKVVLLAEIQKKEEEIRTKCADIALFRAEWSEKDKQRQEKEQLLQEESKKATEKRMRMNRIKNIKELQALQREIDQIKLGNSQLEEELIKLLEEAEAYAGTLTANEDELKQLEAAWREKQGEIEAQVAGIERAVATAVSSA